MHVDILLLRQLPVRDVLGNFFILAFRFFSDTCRRPVEGVELFLGLAVRTCLLKQIDLFPPRRVSADFDAEFYCALWFDQVRVKLLIVVVLGDLYFSVSLCFLLVSDCLEKVLW